MEAFPESERCECSCPCSLGSLCPGVACWSPLAVGYGPYDGMAGTQSSYGLSGRHRPPFPTATLGVAVRTPRAQGPRLQQGGFGVYGCSDRMRLAASAASFSASSGDFCPNQADSIWVCKVVLISCAPGMSGSLRDVFSASTNGPTNGSFTMSSCASWSDVRPG